VTPVSLRVCTDADEVLTVLDDIVAVYRSAFTGPGQDESEADVVRFRDHQLPVHARREGFRCVLAYRGDEMVGFTYGYTGRRGQWWTDAVLERVPAGVAEEWLDGHFELVELAVSPSEQGQGLGAALVGTLLDGLPHDRALLTTYRDDRPAPRLYRRLGWQRIAEAALEDSDLWGIRLR
jgi:ribosomal protein S18 acetylase RimI-like enzyme